MPPSLFKKATTVFSQDIMTVEESKVLDTEVSMTIIDGEVVYEKTD